MLRGMHKASTNWLGRVVMGVVLGLIADQLRASGASATFSAASAARPSPRSAAPKSRVEQFRQIYNDRLQQLGRQVGRPITPDQARALGLDRQIARPADRRSRARRARAPAAARPLRRRDRARRSRPIRTSRAPTGQFDRARFEQIIRRPATPRRASSPSSAASRCASSSPRRSAASSTVPKTALGGVQPLPERAARDRLRRARPRAGRRHRRRRRPRRSRNISRSARSLFRAPEYRKIVAAGR